MADLPPALPPPALVEIDKSERPSITDRINLIRASFEQARRATQPANPPPSIDPKGDQVVAQFDNFNQALPFQNFNQFSNFNDFSNFNNFENFNDFSNFNNFNNG